MKKSFSTLSLIVLVAFAAWQYWNESKPANKSVPQKTTHAQTANQSDSQNLPRSLPADKGSKSADYDVSLAEDNYGQNRNAPVDYYMLALSWSPAFCAEQFEKFNGDLPQAAQYQCGVKRQFGWVVHGLWPQNAKAREVSDHPRFCQGDLAPLPQNLLAQYLAISPGEKLLQGEWEKHGACAFKDAKSYFDKMAELYNRLTLPAEKPDKKELFRWIKAHNPALKNVFLGASRNELYVCYDLQFTPMDCPR